MGNTMLSKMGLWLNPPGLFLCEVLLTMERKRGVLPFISFVYLKRKALIHIKCIEGGICKQKTVKNTD